MTPQPFARRDYLVALGVFLASLAIYILTLAPTVTGEDSGELIAAAYTLGIPHPPGYPLWCMLAKLFIVIIPFGTIAARVAAMSAFWAAGTAALLALIVIRLTHHRAAAATAALAFAFSDVFWSQSNIAEVYTLNAFFVALCILVLAIWHETRTNKLLYTFALLYGLGLGNHQTMHFLGPVFALFIVGAESVRPIQPGDSGSQLGAIVKRLPVYLLMLAIAFAAWLVVHLYLPIRAAADPPMNWGDPSTWNSFWDHILRRQYAHGSEKDAYTFMRVWLQIQVFLQSYAKQFTYWLALLPLLGIRPLWRTDRRRGALILGLMFYTIIGFIWILNPDYTDRDIWLNRVFFIPAHMMAAVLIGVAFNAITHNQKYARAALALYVIVPLSPLVMNYHANDKSDYYFAHDFGMNILNTLDPNSIYFSTADLTLFSPVYLHFVEGVRPDITIATIFGYVDKDLCKDMPPLKETFAIRDSVFELGQIQEWVIANSKRPVFFASKREITSIPGARTIETGLLYKVLMPGEQPPARNYWDEYTWHTLDPEDARGDYSAKGYISTYYRFHGKYLIDIGQYEQGLEDTKLASRIGNLAEGDIDALAGVCQAALKQLDARTNDLGIIKDVAIQFLGFKDVFTAARYYERGYNTAKATLGATHLTTLDWLDRYGCVLSMNDDPYGARETFKKAIKTTERVYGKTHSTLATYYDHLGLILHGCREYEQAFDSFKRAYEVDAANLGPDHPDTGRDLYNMSVAMRSNGNAVGADELKEQAVAIFRKNTTGDHPYLQAAEDGILIVTWKE